MRPLALLLFVLPTFAAAIEVCIDVPDIDADPNAPAGLVQVYREVAVGLERFPSLLTAVEEQSPKLCLSGNMDNAHGYLDIEQNRIYLSNKIFEPGNLLRNASPPMTDTTTVTTITIRPSTKLRLKLPQMSPTACCSNRSRNQ